MTSPGFVLQPASRYLNHTVQAVTDSAGVTRQTIFPSDPRAKSFKVLDYTWDSSDRVDLLAARMYGDETMWWVIARANPEIMDWMAIKPGTVVRIPSGIT